MSNTKSSNNLVVPSARESMNKFKMEAASEVGVNLKQGYNGDLTSPGSRQRRRPDGEEDDRAVRKQFEIIAPRCKNRGRSRRGIGSCPLFLEIRLAFSKNSSYNT